MKFTFDDLQKLVALYSKRDATYIDFYKKYFMWSADLKAKFMKKKETSWMSAIVSPTTYSLVTTVYGLYLDNAMAWEVYKIVKNSEGEDVEGDMGEVNKDNEEEADAIFDLLTYIYDNSGSGEETDMMALNAIITGNGFGIMGYERGRDHFEYVDKSGGKKKIVLNTDIPSITSIVGMNIFPEWAAKTIRKSKYVVRRRVMDVETFKSFYEKNGITLKEDADKQNTVLIQKDWDMVFKYLLFNNTNLSKDFNSIYNGVKSNGLYTDIFTDNSYSIGDPKEKNSLLEVFEVHTDYTIQVFANGIDCGTMKRGGPRKVKPFLNFRFGDGMNRLFSMGLGYVAKPLQDMIDYFTNRRINVDKLNANSPLYVSADEPFFSGFDYMERFPGQTIKIQDMSNRPQPGAPIDGANVANEEVNILTQNIKDAIGISGYVTGSQGKVERVAKGVQELVEATERGLKGFMKSISRELSFASKYMTILAVYFMEEETITRITGSAVLKDIALEDIIHGYDISFNLESMKSMKSQAQLEVLRRFIQDFGQAKRQDGTPLMDQDKAYQMMLDLQNLPSDLLLSPEQAKKNTEQQIDSNRALQQKQGPDVNIISPAGGNEVGQQAQENTGMPSVPGVQGGSLGEGAAQATNVNGVN